MPSLWTTSIRRSNVEAHILQRYFDLVIHGTAYITHLSLYDIVSEAYSEDEIAFVNGSELGAPESDPLYSEVCGKQGVDFRREFVC